MSNKRFVCFLLFVLLGCGLVAGGGAAYGQATSFSLEGTVKEATGEAVGAGFRIEATNQRVPIGWLVDPVFSTRDDGTYTITYLDPFGGRTTNVNDEIRIAVTDLNERIVGRKTYVVTQAAVDALGDNVEVLLSGILVEFAPASIPADGLSTSTITVTVQNENGDLETNDTLTIGADTGTVSAGVTNNGDGTYTATYTAPSLALTASTPDTLRVQSTVLGEGITATITLQVVPTVVTVTVEPNTFSADTDATGAVRVSVTRGVPVVGETIAFQLSRTDGNTDVGTITDAVDSDNDGVYEATYTPATAFGQITLLATATGAGGSSDPSTITINVGPPTTITLTATPETVSSEANSLITATVTDVAGNGVGALTLNGTASSGGTITPFVGDAVNFGVYTATYTAPVVAADITEAVTVTVAGSDVSGQLPLNLTPVPPREVNLLVVAGTVFKKDSTTLPAVGVNVEITVNAKPSQTVQTATNGFYSITIFEPLGVAARTGDLVSITVTDGSGAERGKVGPFALTNDDLGEGTSATVERDVPTDIGFTSSTLAVTGTVVLEDGQSSAPAGLSVVVSSSRGNAEAGTTSDSGTYSVEFSAAPPTVVSETGDVLTVTVTDTDGATIAVTHTLTTGEVEAGQIEIAVATTFPARESQLFVVEGTILLEDGQTPVAREGLQVVVSINAVPQPATSTEASGSYQITIFDPLALGVIAQTGDPVDVEVTALDAAGGVWTAPTHRLSTEEVKAQRVAVNVTTDLKASTNTLVVSGRVLFEDGQTTVDSGLTVTVTNSNRAIEGTATTDGNGAYSVMLAATVPAIAAQTDDVLTIAVADAGSGAFQVDRTLATGEVEAGQVTVDVQTDFIASESQLFVVEGTIFLEDGRIKARDGLQVVVNLNGVDQPATSTEAGGAYQITIFDPLAAGVIAQTGDAIDVEVTALDQNRVVGTAPTHELSTSEIKAQRARVDVTTDLTITTNLLVVAGAISNPDGTIAEGGLRITITAGSNPAQATVTEANGTYSATFFDPLGTVAESRDVVTVEVNRAATGDKAVKTIELTSTQILAQSSTVDVQFPSILIEDVVVSPPSPLTLDVDGQAGTEITVTVINSAGELVTSGITVNASVASGVGAVTSVAANNGDGTYTANYSVSKAFGSSTVAIITSAVASPTETVELAVVDELSPNAVAIADPDVVGLNEPVLFDGSQSSDNVAIASFIWDFDGDSVEDFSGVGPTIEPVTFPGYAAPGVFAATLTVTDTAGNRATDAVAVSAGGLIVVGTILEADGRPLQTNGAVVVRVTHTGLGINVEGFARQGRYSAAFEKPESDQMAPGDELVIEVLSVADSSVLGGAIHRLTTAELSVDNIAAVADAVTDRTSTYTIRGNVVDGTGGPVTGAIVSARGLQVGTDSLGAYRLYFQDYLTNPTVGEEILITAEIPGGLPRRALVIVFETPDRVVTADLNPLRLGGLSINTPHYRAFIDRLIGRAIAKTQVGQLLGGEQLLALIRTNPSLQADLVGLIEGFIPPGTLPTQLILGTDLPLVFAQPENLDLENFGNGIVPRPLGDFLSGLRERSAGLPPVLTGDKLDLYLVAPTADADRVMFTLSGPGLMTAEAQRVDASGTISHKFQLEEEQAILLLPSWPNLDPEMAEIFSSVTLVYATRALPPPTEPTSPPNPIQAQIEDFASQAEAFGIDIEQLGTAELITEVATLITESAELGGEIQGELGTALSDIAAQVELPPDLLTELTDLQTQLGGLDLGQFAFNRLRHRVAFPGPPPAEVLRLSIPEILRLSQEDPPEIERLLGIAQKYLTDLETYLDAQKALLRTEESATLRTLIRVERTLSYFTRLAETLSGTVALLGRIDTTNSFVGRFVSQLKSSLQARLDRINDRRIPRLQTKIARLRDMNKAVQDRLDSVDVLLGTIVQLRSATSLEEVFALAGSVRLNRQIVFDPDMYNREPLQPHTVGDQVIWETTVDVELGNTYYYYYEVELAFPLDFDLLGVQIGATDYDRWSIPDPRNLQLEDRGIVEQLFTEEVQDAIAPILDPVVQAVISGGNASVTITPEQQQAILDIITANAEPLYAEILSTLDPRIASLFTVPTLNSSQSLWTASFDFDTNADGEYELDASVLTAEGTLLDQIAGKMFTVDRQAPEAGIALSVGENASLYRNDDGVYIATALPSGPGPAAVPQATLIVDAIAGGDLSDLTAYLYQMIRHEDGSARQRMLHTWLSLPVAGDVAGFGSIISNLLPLDQLSFLADLFDIAPVTFAPPHQVNMLLRGEDNNPRLIVGQYGIRATGLDNVFNLSSNTPPMRLDIVPPDADIAKVTFIVIGDCNGDGDTDDLFESGSVDDEMIIFSDTTNVKLSVVITERTVHPLASVAIQFKPPGDNAGWQNITVLNADDLDGAVEGTQFGVDWSIDNFDALLQAGDRVMVRAVATNRLLSDLTPSIATFGLDADECPVEPGITAVDVAAENLNADSGAPQGTITISAFTRKRTAPETATVRFEIRRSQGGAWEAIGEATLDSTEITEDIQVGVIEDLIRTVVGGASSASVAPSYRNWSISLDTTTLDDTILDDSPAASDATQDDNPYVVRAIAVDVTGEEHVPAYAVTEDFSVDNFAPVVIVEVADEAGLITADETGLFVASGLNDADTPDPQLSLTARSAAFPGTFAVVISVRNPDGTPGDSIAVDDITFSPSGDLTYTATIEDLTIVENGAYLFQAVALDVDGNREERNASPAIAVAIENFTPPPDFAEEPSINTIIIDDRSVVEVQLGHPGGFPVSNEFVLTFISSDITADNIDIFIDGVSARARGILIVEEIQAGALAAPVATNRQLALQTVLRTFSVSLDTSDPSVVPPGVRNLLGAINKPNGSTTFALPLINVDNIAPLVEIISPTEGQEVSGLPTIHATFDDGVGGGIDPSDPSTVEVAFTRLPPSGAGPDFRADGTGVQLPQPVSPQVTSQSGDIVYTRSEALPGGAYRATVTLTDSAGNVQAESIEFTVERTLPSVSILSLVAGQVLDKDQQLIINAAFTGAGVQVTAFSINDTAVTPTQEGNRLIYTQDAPLLNGESSLLQEGRNTVSIQITDGDGNTAQDTVTFTVTLGDTTPPLIAQVSPQGIIRTATAIVSVVALDDQSGVDSVTLSVDGAEPVNGASLEVTALAPGDHMVVAIATNGAGLPAQFTWSFTVLLDDTPPVISVVAPQGIVKTGAVTVSAIVIDEQSNITRVTIALDGEDPPIVVVPSDAGMADDGAAADGAADDGSVAEEAQPFKGGQVSRDLTDLTDGTHTVTVVAENAGGSSTHTWTFTVELDTTPPEIVTFAPLGTIRDARPLVSVTVSDESGINTDTLRLIIAGVPGSQGTGRRSSSTSRTITFTPTIDVDPGTYTVRATVQDVFGNTTEAEWVFTVELDRVPPQITATAPHGIVRVEKPKISVSASDDLSGVDAIDIMVKSSAGDAVAGLSQTRLDGTSADFTPTNALEAGTYEVDVKVADKGGNVASGKWSFTVEFDTVPPSITVVAPQGDARVTERKPTISATYTDSVSGVDGSSVKLWLDGTPLQIAESNVSATQVTYTPQVDLEFGRHTVKLEVSDLAPKANTATQEWSFVVESDEIAMVNPRNFPNPFASATTIAFTLAQQAKITIEIYDVTSRLVRPLVQDEQREAGPVAIQWDGKTTEGDDLARGVYFCQITVDSSLEPEAFVLKMALIRDE